MVVEVLAMVRLRLFREQINGFLNEWNENCDHKQWIYVSYDSTNKNCQTGDIDLIEYGKIKDDQELKLHGQNLSSFFSS